MFLKRRNNMDKGNPKQKVRLTHCVREGDEVKTYPLDPEIDDLLKTTLNSSGKYHNLELFHQAYNEAGTRFCYRADWGHQGQEDKIPVIVKVDKPKRFIKSPRADLHGSRGYNTSNEVDFLTKINSPERYHIAKIRDFFMKKTCDGKPLAISIEDFFENSLSLEGYVKKLGPMSPTQVCQVFGQVIKGIDHLNTDLEIYYRDLKPSNILLRKINRPNHPRVKNRLEVLITDFANACKKNSIDKKPVPSAGGHLVTNPFLFQNFTGEVKEYDEKSEIYSIGANMYFALTGDYMFDCDSSKGTARGIIGNSTVDLLDNHSLIDPKKYIQVVKTNTKSKFLDSNTNELKKIIRNCLLSPLNQGYESTEELFNKTKKWDNLWFDEHYKEIMAAIGVLTLGGFWLGWDLYAYGPGRIYRNLNEVLIKNSNIPENTLTNYFNIRTNDNQKIEYQLKDFKSYRRFLKDFEDR